MKKIIYIILLINVLFASQKSIKIAIPNNMIPYAFVDEYNEPKGMFVDYWKLWAVKTNKNIEFIPSVWQGTLKSITNGKADIHSGLFINDERKEYISFLKPIYNASSKIFIKNSKSKEISKTSDLNNKKIGLIANSFYDSYFRINYPKIKIVRFDKYDNMIESLFIEEVDAIIDDSLVSWFHLTKRYKHNEVTTIKDFSLFEMFYSGISNNIKDSDFHKLVLSGINKISKIELTQIKEKWIINKELNSGEKEKSIFTQEELIYIQNSPPLIMGIENWGQVSYIGVDGKMKGLAGDIIKNIFEISGLTYKSINADWHILLDNFKNKKIDILPATYFTKERATYGLYSKKYMTMKDFLYINKNDTRIKSMSDLNNKKLAIIKDYGTIPIVKENFPNINIVETKDLDDSLSRLLNKEVDALFETQLSTESRIREMSITTLKGLYQNDIPSNDLHVFSKKGDFLLQSILQKSLNAIPQSIKNDITKRWLYAIDEKELNIAFGKGREPYSIDKSYLKGIEYDLINKILNKSEISIKHITHLNYNELQDALKNDSSLDMAVTVKQKDDGYYYSNDFIEFENIVISRKKDNLVINNVNDLKDKKVASFKDAYKYLGDKYFNLFNPSNKTNLYQEYDMQELQVQDFLDKKSDVIVLDKNIFLWHLKKLSSSNISQYSIHHIFPDKNAYQVAFKEAYLRDKFNKNFQIMKDNDEIKDIFNNYTTHDIEAKVKIDSLISTIVSKYIYDNEIEKLNKIVDKFSSLKYIKKLEVYDNKNVLLSTNLEEILTNYILQDSHYNISNIPIKVGYIKVYFDEKILSEYSKNNETIPKIDFFKELDSYAYIKEIYKQFGYLQKGISFTKNEQLFIENNPVIKFSESDWAPLSMIDGKEFEGVLSDYIKLLETKTGIHFKYIKTRKWSDVLNKFKDNTINFIPGVANTKSIQDMGLVSDSLVKFHFAIVTGENGSFAHGLEDLKGKTVALPKYFTSNILIREKYPQIKVINTKNIKEALTMVSKGKVDAFVGHEAVAVYNIKKYYKNLKIIGLSKEEFSHHMLIKKSHPELLSIVNKVIATITQKQKKDINDRWIQTKINTEIDYTLLYKIIGMFFIILIIIFYFTKKLATAKNAIELTNNKLHENIVELNNTKDELEDSNHELEVSLENLKQTQVKLIESEKMASLGGLVAGVAHEINTPVGIGLTGSTHFMDITKQIIEKFDNQEMTKSDFEEYTADSLELATLIYSNLDRTKELVNSFKQISVDQTSEQKRKFELKKYINKMLISINNVLKKRNIKVIVTSDEQIKLDSYPGAISQIITNLIFNSLNHGFDEDEIGTITIDLKKENEKTIIIYKDDGNGISKENITKIFDPFFTTNRDKGGTGLGLNIIYNIITTQLNGTITCTSTENFGVEFCIKF